MQWNAKFNTRFQTLGVIANVALRSIFEVVDGRLSSNIRKQYGVTGKQRKFLWNQFQVGLEQ